MRPFFLLLEIGLTFFVSAIQAAEALPSTLPPSTSARLEFQLPLPGESIPSEGGGLLVETDSSIRQVLFHWTGPDSGSADGTIQFEGFFQAQTGPLKPGAWVLEAQGFDASGHLVSRRSTTFEVGASPKASQAPTASTQRVIQDLYLSANFGLKFGVAQNDLQLIQSLKPLPNGRLGAGPAMEPFDQFLSGNAAMVYNLQQGMFRLKLRGTTDASETWTHAPSPSRWGADLYWSDWVEGHLGDQYPAWSQLLMDGTRIRGAGVGLIFVKDANPLLRADLAVGSLRSTIDPQVLYFANSVDTSPSQLGRSIQVAHLGIGDGTPVGLNFTILHSKDLIEEVDMPLHDRLGGASPRENMAVGADFVTRLWKNRFEAYLNSAMSLTTDDIRLGSLSDSPNDSIRSKISSPLDDWMTINYSTRGAELLASESEGKNAFIWENLALRTGGRFLFPLADWGRMRLDSRWIHVGTEFQSFARSVQESPRTGWEWSTTSALAHDALLLAVSGSEVDAHPALGSSIPTHSVNANLAWTPTANPVSWHAESGAQNSGGGTETRNEAWNAGGGLFGTVRLTENGNLFWRTGYGYFENLSRIQINTMGTDTTRRVDSQFTTRSYQTIVQNHSLDASLRWRPSRDLEWRTGYMLASQGIPNDTVKTEQNQTHRIQGGGSIWGFMHKLECALDGSLVLHPSQSGDDATGWDQTFRTSWDFDNSRSVRFAERWVHLPAGRDDFRLEMGWEAWY